MLPDSSRIGPVVLEPLLKERIWGASRLPAVYAQPEPGHPVGEIWLTAHECAVVADSPPAATLGDVVARAPEAFAAGDGFPLLLKLLFPREKLSVQVHPDDRQAGQLGQSRGKTECWYVLEAEPGATVAVGFRESLGPAEIAGAIANGTLEQHLRQLPVAAGDMVFVDAGTVHAIGPGVVILETQQYSDVTYRLFDYGRPRELHVEAGLAVTRHSALAGLVAPEPRDGYTRLVECAYFAVDRFELQAGAAAPLGHAASLQLLFALAPGCRVVSDGGSLDLPPGRAVVLPREGVAYQVSAEGGGALVRVLAPAPAPASVPSQVTA